MSDPTPQTPPPSPAPPGVGPLLPFLLAFLAFGSWHVDDAGISYAYARSLAAGLGPVPFAGSAVVEGFSHPLWVALLAAAAALGIDPLIASKALALPLALGALLLTWRAALLGGARRGEANAAIGFAGLCAPFALWTSGGLETALLAFGVGLALGGPARLLPIAMVALSWTRPEGVLYALGALAARRHLTYDPASDAPDPDGGAHAQALVIALLSASALFGLRFLVFASPLPQSYLAKGGDLPADLLMNAAKGASYLGMFLFTSQLGPLALLALGMGTPARTRRLSEASLALLASALPLVVLGGGDWMPQGRLLAPLVPALSIGLIPALVAGGRGRLVLLVGLMVAAVAQGVQLAQLYRRPPLPLDQVARVGDALVAASFACPEGDRTIASPDIGGLLWRHPEVAVVDLAGLITKGEPSEAVRAGTPAVVLLHGPWVTRTGLDDAAMAAAGYRLSCRRSGVEGPSEAEHPPTLWVRASCTAPLAPEREERVARWCERGSR